MVNKKDYLEVIKKLLLMDCKHLGYKNLDDYMMNVYSGVSEEHFLEAGNSICNNLSIECFSDKKKLDKIKDILESD